MSKYEQHEYDVVIVGAGGAGLRAAIEASAQGGTFSANLSLTTHGNRQTVSIRPQGTSITGVTLALDRR